MTRETSDWFQQRYGSGKFGQFFPQARDVVRIQRVSSPIIERILTIFFLVQSGDFGLVRDSPSLTGGLRKPGGITLRLIESNAACGIIFGARVDFVVFVEFGELRACDLEASNFHIAPQDDFGNQLILSFYRDHGSVVAAGPADLLRPEHGLKRRTFLHRFGIGQGGLEEILVEPCDFLFDFAHLVGQFARAMRLAGEHHEFYGHLAVILEHAEIGPALRGRNVGIGSTVKNQNRGLHLVHFEEGRFVDVELRILHR